MSYMLSILNIMTNQAWQFISLENINNGAQY